MKFNFLRVMALVLVAVMCLSLFACNNSGNDGNGNGNENVPPSAKDENQLFAELKAAYLSSLSHTDADSFIPESGKVYVVTYVEITQDKDLGITHVFVM